MSKSGNTNNLKISGCYDRPLFIETTPISRVECREKFHFPVFEDEFCLIIRAPYRNGPCNVSKRV